MWLIGGGYLSNDDDNDAHMEKGISFLKITAQYFYFVAGKKLVLKKNFSFTLLALLVFLN